MSSGEPERELRMIRLLLTSDLHQWIPKWNQLIDACSGERPDYLGLAGDLLPKTSHMDQRLFFTQMRRYLLKVRTDVGCKVFLYLGNDDHHVLEPRLDELVSEDLCVNLNRRVYRESGLVFVGLNVVRDYPFGYKHYCVRDEGLERSPIQFMGEGVTITEDGRYVHLNDLTEYLRDKPSFREELESILARIRPEEMAQSVWLIHQPPSELGMDICAHGERVGSPSLLAMIRQYQPLLGCSGHIHESPYQPGGQWVASIGRTRWVQPGQVDSKLHYVIADLSDALSVLRVSHSVFGEARSLEAKEG